MASAAEFQHTLAKAASLSGTSLHTGARVSLKIQPAAANSGIKFKRKDLQDEPTIDATIANVKTVERATTIGEGSMRVHTVEHVLAALSGLGVDNAMIEMDATVAMRMGIWQRWHEGTSDYYYCFINVVFIFFVVDKRTHIFEGALTHKAATYILVNHDVVTLKKNAVSS